MIRLPVRSLCKQSLDMVYPDLVKQYVNLSKVNNKFTRSGNPTPLYLEFIEFCKNNAVDIAPLTAYPFKIIKLCYGYIILTISPKKSYVQETFNEQFIKG